ncbi:hypothetical protein A0U40_09760 [[Bacillus] sp. KCTC 13219]|nr:hypothetical protein A0U40_09760 [[Bacillus] sp. KCTC 13219]
MKNATVTIDYTSFQAIKEKADKYDSLAEENENMLSQQGRFIDILCNCIEDANEQATAKHKQYFIDKGIKAICEQFDMNVDIEFAGLNEGVAPSGGS